MASNLIYNPPVNWPGGLLLSLANPIFSQLQPDHTGCSGDLQLFHISDPISGDDQLAVLPYPVRSQILPMLTSLTDGRIGDDGDPQAIGPEREL